MTKRLFDLVADGQKFASIDLGSGGFYLAIAQKEGDQLQKITSLGQKVRLGAGLDAHNHLDQEHQQKGLDCLRWFVGRLQEYDVDANHIRIVATSALRRAINRDDFIQAANAFLPSPVEIISGKEEARLIYLGVARTCPSPKKRLVIDIGGGSTELIIGKQDEVLLAESASMGSVSFMRQFFPDGKISQLSFDKAIYAAQRQIVNHANTYKKTGFDEVVGTSGAIESIANALAGFGFGQGISLAGVEQLKDSLIQAGRVEAVQLTGLKLQKTSNFPASVAILLAIMKVFGIRLLRYCNGALREGVMYDLMARLDCRDVRDKTVTLLMDKFGLDRQQAHRVATTSLALFENVYSRFGWNHEDANLLQWSSLLHETGRFVGSSRYYQHTAYLLAHTEMAGFSCMDQQKMASLTCYQQGRLEECQLQALQALGGHSLVAQTLILRLSVLLNHSRIDRQGQWVGLSIDSEQDWRVTLFSKAPEDQACLLDLMDEIDNFARWGIRLTVQS